MKKIIYRKLRAVNIPEFMEDLQSPKPLSECEG